MRFYNYLFSLHIFLLTFLTYQSFGNIYTTFDEIDSLKSYVNEDTVDNTDKEIYDYYDLDEKPKIVHNPKPIGCVPFLPNGTIVTAVIIDTTGKVIDVKIIKSIAQLDTAVINICKKMVFSPGKVKDKKVISKMLIPFKFINNEEENP